MNLKAIGATLLISGTMLGAGMLALPLISAGLGVQNSIVFLISIWLCMTYTGLILLEVCLNYPEGTGFEAIAEDLFGNLGKWIINVSLLLLLYSLSCAYISGGSSIYQSNFTHYLDITLSGDLICIIFTSLIAFNVYISTKAVDVVNRVLFSVNIIVFFLLVFTIHPYIHTEYLSNDQDSTKYAFAAIPVFITAFGFHCSIPSIIKYIGKDKPKILRNVFIAGGLIPLVVYIIWEITTLGSLPRFGPHSFAYVSSQGASVGVMLQEMQIVIPNKSIIFLISAFSSMAMFTSYLCVSLGLFDSVASSLKKGNANKDRLFTALLTYMPPLIIILVYPDGFVGALGIAAIFLTVLAILFPVVSLIKIRANPHQKEYKVVTNKIILVTIALIGFQVIIDQILRIGKVIPIF